MAERGIDASGPAWTRPRLPGAILLGAAALALVALVAFSFGAYPVSGRDLLGWAWASLTGAPSGLDPSAELVIERIRGPRILLAMIVGAALSAAGAAYQGLFRNPLVSPDILVVSSGAAFGAVLGIFLSLPLVAVQGLAFLGGLAAVGVVYLIAATLSGRDPVLVLVLAGIVIGALLGCGLGLLFSTHHPDQALAVATHALLLKNGQTQAVGRAADVLTADRLSALFGVPLAVERAAGSLVCVPRAASFRPALGGTG